MKYSLALGQKFVICSDQKCVPHSEGLEKAKEVFDYLVKKDVEIERFDDCGQDVTSADEFLNCKAIN